MTSGSIDGEHRMHVGENPRGLADLADAVLALAREIERHHDHEGYVPLTVNELLALRSLDREDGISPSELAARIGLHRSNLSTALRGLEAKGFIVRSERDGDGRGVVVETTALAAEHLALLHERWHEVLAPTAHGAEDFAGLAARLLAMGDELAARRRLEE